MKKIKLKEFSPIIISIIIFSIFVVGLTNAATLKTTLNIGDLFLSDNTPGWSYKNGGIGIATSTGYKLDGRNIIPNFGTQSIITTGGRIKTDNGNIYTNNGHIYTSSGSLGIDNGDIWATNGNIYTASGSLATGNGNIGTNSGNIQTDNGDIGTLKGDISTLNGTISNGNLIAGASIGSSIIANGQIIANKRIVIKKGEFQMRDGSISVLKGDIVVPSGTITSKSTLPSSIPTTLTTKDYVDNILNKSTVNINGQIMTNKRIVIKKGEFQMRDGSISVLKGDIVVPTGIVTSRSTKWLDIPTTLTTKDYVDYRFDHKSIGVREHDNINYIVNTPVDWNNQLLMNIKTPQNNGDAVNKAYVDNSSPIGTLCGLSIVKTPGGQNKKFNCDGFNPKEQCPKGYIQISFQINQTVSDGYIKKIYTCSKNK